MSKQVDHKKIWGAGYHEGMKAAGNNLRGTEIPCLDATQMMLCWNPGTSSVRLCNWPDKEGISNKYQMTSLACYSHVRAMNFEQRKAFVFIEAMHLIIRDRVNPEALHLTLLGLKEYRSACSDDMPYLYA